jgi:hypothetical protein
VRLELKKELVIVPFLKPLTKGRKIDDNRLSTCHEWWIKLYVAVKETVKALLC